jgi:hypothetical protein
MAKAKRDRLLVALIAKLPMELAPWPRAERIAWLQMIAMAFDVVYGPCSGIRVVDGGAHGDEAGRSANTPRPVFAGHHVTAPAASHKPQRFYVDRDGFAMGDGKPITVEELPAGTILWDERVGIDCGDAAAILWRGIGTSRRSLPPGIILMPVFDES